MYLLLIFMSYLLAEIQRPSCFFCIQYTDYFTSQLLMNKTLLCIRYRREVNCSSAGVNQHIIRLLVAGYWLIGKYFYH